MQSPNSYFMDVKCPGEAAAGPTGARGSRPGEGVVRAVPYPGSGPDALKLERTRWVQFCILEE